MELLYGIVIFIVLLVVLYIIYRNIELWSLKQLIKKAGKDPDYQKWLIENKEVVKKVRNLSNQDTIRINNLVHSKMPHQNKLDEIYKIINKIND